MSNPEHPPRLDLAPLLAWSFGPILRERLAAAVKETSIGLPVGLPLGDRQAALKRLESDLENLEREEERLIRDSETQGQPIQRRPDARCDLVLAHDFDLR